MDYPIWDLAMGGGVLIGIVAITHVLVSHFAVGGGIVIALAETLAVKRGDFALRELARRTSLMLILISTVFGAISGVGIWVTIGLIQPAATSALIHIFVWGWAIEWVFFILEVATALAYSATWDRVRPRTHLLLIWLYAAAAFLSLVVIQGIIAFMITPGQWVTTRSFWDGILNPTYVPGLLLRTGICVFLAGAYMTFAALREKEAGARARLVRWLAVVQVVGVLVAYGGYRWWEVALPETIRSLFLGQKALLASLASTRHLLLWALAAYLAIVLLGLLLPHVRRWPVAAVALIAAFVFFGGYERLREGARKPFVIRDYMFSNGVLVEEIADLNRTGVLAKARWAKLKPGDGTEETGRAVFRAECASCHTLDGYLSIRKLVAPVDPDMLGGVLAAMQEDGLAYSSGAAIKDGHVETGSLTYPLMPPFVGTEEEMAALAEYLLAIRPAAATEVADAR